jgi:hypothetical protein
MPRNKRGKGKGRSKSGEFRKFANNYLKSTSKPTAESSPTLTSTSVNGETTPLKLPKTIANRLKISTSKIIKFFIYYLALPFKKVNKIALSCILISTICIAGFFYLKRSYPVTIKSNLTEVKEIELRFKDFQSQGYSPVCGCYEEKRPEEWRGVAFATRHLNIERKGNLPLTDYMITVAAPRRVSWSGLGERFSADLYYVSLPKDESFNPKLLVSNNTPSSYQIIEKKHFDPQRYFMLFSDKSLNVDLLGDKPLGAWIPSDGAKVKIGYSKGMFPASKTTASITEEYKVESNESLAQEIVGIPLGDFLGPNIVLWTEDAKLNIIAGKDMISVPSNPSNQRRVITALVANPPFSLRVACIPEDSDAASMYREIGNEKDIRDSEEDYLPAIRHPTNEIGTINVSIPNIEEGAEEFAEVYGKMKENDLVMIPNIPGDFIFIDQETGKEIKRAKSLAWMEFRYPPIPPNPGFNIFGSFSSINLNQVKGNILIGSHLFDINVPSNLEIQDISSLEVDGGVIKVPIRWDTKGSVADIQFQATAQVKLNGEPLGKGFDIYRQYVEYILLFSSILSTMGAVVQVVLARRSLKQNKR